MLFFFTKFFYIFFLIITSVSIVYYIKLYADTNKIIDLVLSILSAIVLLFSTYKLFHDHNVSLILMTIFIKVLPIILLTIIDTVVFKTKMTFNKGLGIVIIISGILFMEM